VAAGRGGWGIGAGERDRFYIVELHNAIVEQRVSIAFEF
jgi:hypothetical protein